MLILSMTKPILFLYSQYYLEIFLKVEIVKLSEAFETVYVLPTNMPANDFENKYPENVKLIEFNYRPNVYPRNLILKYPFIYIDWFICEFIYSKKRFNYIKRFKRLFFELSGNLQSAVNLKEFLSKYQINENTVHYAYWFNEQGSILSILNRLKVKGKFLARVHGYDFQEEQSMSQHIPFRIIEAKYLDKIYPISNFAVNYLDKRFKIRNCELAHLGVKDEGTNSIISNDSFFTIVTCSRLSGEKRPTLLAQLIKEINLSIKWFHFGTGPLLNQFIECTTNLPGNIDFEHQLNIENNDLMTFYKYNHVDLFINVSCLEGIPVTLMEAISFGIPVIGTNVGGVSELVNSRTGILFEVDFDIISTSQKIKDFITMNSRNIEFRKNIKHFWSNNFDAEKNAETFVEKILNLDDSSN